jgi:hypothetical protein
MFSILVKLKTFTKHAFCQQRPPAQASKVKVIAAMQPFTASDRHTRRPDGSWRGKLNLFSEFSISRCGNARTASENVSGIDRTGFRIASQKVTRPKSCRRANFFL